MFKTLMDKLQGRHTAFALFFTLSGTVMAWFHRLDPNFVAFVTVMQGWIFAHSTKESYYEEKSSGNSKA